MPENPIQLQAPVPTPIILPPNILRLLAHGQIPNKPVCRFVFQLHRILTNQLTALIVATACQALEMEASPRQRQCVNSRRIQKQNRILRHPSCRNNPADAEVTFINADHIGESRVARPESTAAGCEGVYLSLLHPTYHNQVYVAVAVLPNFASSSSSPVGKPLSPVWKAFVERC